MPTYRGREIQYSVFNRKDDTYSLIDHDGEVVVDLKRHEYMAQPQLRTLENRNGRHRGAGQKNKRRSDRVAGNTRRNDAADAPLYAWINTGWASPRWTSSPGLTAASIRQMMQIMEGKFEKPALKRDGIVAGEIIGYRCWRIENGLLRSVYQSDVWQPGQILEGRELGDWDQRGIHAWKDSGSEQYHDYIRSYLNQGSDPFTAMILWGKTSARGVEARPAMVTGTVFLWGDVVEHERGYRAEYARVRSLDWLYPDADMMGREQQALDTLRRAYALLGDQG
jgi:hypothetical protein